MGAVELQPIPGQPVKRIMDVFNRSFKKGLFIRTTGSTVACAPPLISEKKDIDFFINTLGESITESSKYM